MVPGDVQLTRAGIVQAVVVVALLLAWTAWRFPPLLIVGASGATAAVLNLTGIWRTNRAAYWLAVALAGTVAQLCIR